MSQKVEVEIGVKDRFSQGFQNFRKQVGDAGARIDEFAQRMERSGQKVDGVFESIDRRIRQVFAVSSLIAFQNKIVEVRGDMEKLQISFETLAGTRIGKQLYEDIKQFATSTPMMMSDLAKGAQTLLGFNIAAEKVMPILSQIGDISMGDAQKFNSLTLAFAQMSSTGKLMGQDLLQMINAGFNPLVQISEKTGKSVAQLKDEMSKGAISVQMVEEAFRDATSEGGKFYGMLEKQSQGMAGSISNLKGAFENMLNDFGQKQQGVLVQGIGLATEALKHYDELAKVILELAAVYGSYKAAVIAVSVAEDLLSGKIIIKTRLLRAAAVAQEFLNKTMLNNPAVLMATAVLSLVSALVIFRNRTDEASEAQERLDKAFNDTQAEIATEQKNIDSLFDELRKAKKGTDEFKNAKDAILNQYGQYLRGLGKEIETLADVEGAYLAVAKAAREATIARGREAALGEANKAWGSTYSANIGKLQGALTNNGVSKNNTKNALKQVQDELRRTGTISLETEKKVRNLLRGSADYGNAGAWFTSLRNNEKSLQEAIERTDEIFQLEDKKVESSTKTVKKLSEAYLEAEKNFNAAKQKVDEMKKSRSDYTEQQWKEAKDILKTAKETYEGLGGDPEGKNAKKYEKSNADNATRRQKQFELEQKQMQQEAAQEQATRAAIEAARIAAIVNGAERERAEQDEQHRLALEAVGNREREMKQALYEYNKNVWEAQNKDKTKHYGDTDAGKAGWEGITLDTGQLQQLQAERDKIEAEYARLSAQRLKEEAQSINDYLKEFGTVQEKRYAIQKEYDQKIAEETDEWRRRQLEAEKQKSVNALEIEVLRTEIDWTTMFDGLGSAMEAEMRDTLEKVEKYMQSNSFKSLSSSDKAEFVRMRNELYDKTGSGVGAFDFSIYTQIANDAKAYQQAVLAAKVAMNQHISATQALEKADKELADAEEALKKAVSEQEKEKAKQLLKEKKQQQKTAQAAVTVTGQAVRNANGQVTTAQSNLQRSESQAEKALNGFADALNQMSNGTLKGFADGLVNLINAIAGNGKTGGLSGLGKAGGIIGAILSIIDALGDDPTKFIDELLDKVANVLETVIQQLPQIIMHIVEGAGNIIAGVGKGILGIFGIGSSNNHQEMVDLQNKLTKSINSTTQALNKMTEQLEKSYGIIAMTNVADAKELIQKNMESIMKGIDSVLSDNYGGGHSDYYHLNKNQDLLGQIQRYGNDYGVNLWEYGYNKYTWQQLLRNNSENVAELFKFIQENDAELWRLITQESGANDGALGEWIEKLIDSYDQLGKADEKLKEQLTTTTADNVFDDFLDSLYNLADGSEDVTEQIAEDWQSMVNRMVINNLVIEKFRERLKGWYEDLANLNQRLANGEISPEQYQIELNGLKDGYTEMVNEAKGEIDQFTEMGIIKPIGEAADEVKKYFEDLRDSWKSTLSDMSATTEEWKNNLIDTILSDLVESTILNVPVTITTTETEKGEQTFDDFAKYLEDWTRRYKEIIEDTTLTDEERNEKLKALIQEQTDLREAQAERSKEMAEGIGKDMTEAFSNSLDNLGDTLLSSLLDAEKDAGELGAEIGKTLVEEMLKEMLATEKYAKPMEQIRQLWQNVLKGGGTWLDENGTFGEVGITYTLDDVLGKISDLNTEIGKDTDIQKATKAWQEYDKALNDVKEEISTSLNSLGDTIIDRLLKLDDDVETIGKQIGATLVKEMLQQAMKSELYAKPMEEIKNLWLNVVKGDGSFTDTEGMFGAKGLVYTIDEVLAKVSALETQISSDMTISGMVSKYRQLYSEASVAITDLSEQFSSALGDMESTAESFSDTLKKNLLLQALDDYINDTYGKELQAKNEELATAVANHDIAAIQRIADEIAALYDSISADDDTVGKIAKAMNELERQLDTTFKDMTDSWVDALMDMEGTAEDWAQNVGRIMTKMLIQQFIAPKFLQPILDDMQKSVNDEMAKSSATYMSVISAALPFVDKMKGVWTDVMPMIEQMFGLFGIYREAVEEVEEAVEGVEYALQDMKSNFVSSLMDMTNSAEDFSKDISKILAQTFIEKFVLGEKFDQQMEYWQQQYESIIGSGMSEDERKRQLKQLRDAIAAAKEGYVNEAMAIQELLGLGTEDSQNATMNMADKITYDQADQLLGVNLAQEMTLEQILSVLKGDATLSTPMFKALTENASGNDEISSQIQTTLQSLAMITQTCNESMLAQVAIANSHLQMIRDYSKTIRDEVLLHLGSMDSKLSNLRNL